MANAITATDLAQATSIVQSWKDLGLDIVFTNGCFDILHIGHVRCLAAAKSMGDKLVVGLNSDASVKRLKGESRPIHDEAARAGVLAALADVDLVIVFGEDTPLQVITALTPDVLVKGGDWKPDQVVGADMVIAHGGKVEIVNLVEGYSTTKAIEKI